MNNVSLILYAEIKAVYLLAKVKQMVDIVMNGLLVQLMHNACKKNVPRFIADRERIALQTSSVRIKNAYTQ